MKLSLRKMPRSWEQLDRRFKVTARGSTLWTEFRGGVLNFLVLAFILQQNETILSLTGVDCECPTFFPVCFFAPTSPFGETYFNCMADYTGHFYTATALCIALCTAVLALVTNTPFVISPSISLNSYFTFGIVSFRQLAGMPWGQSYAMLLAAMFAGAVILLLNLIPKLKFDRIMPKSQVPAITAGLGLFLTFLGLMTTYGIAVVVSDSSTALTLGGCELIDRNPLYDCDTRALQTSLEISIAGQTFDRPIAVEETAEAVSRVLSTSAVVEDPEFIRYMTRMGPHFTPEGYDAALAYVVANPRKLQENTTEFVGTVTCNTNDGIYTCDTYGNEGGKMANNYTRFACIAIVIAAVYLGRTGFGPSSKGVILWTVIVVTLASWSRGASYSFFEDDVWPGGETRFTFFTKIFDFRGLVNMMETVNYAEFGEHEDFIRSFFTVTYLYVMENVGAIYGLACFAGLSFITGNKWIWLIQAASGLVSTYFGIPPVTVHFMSAAGITEGARTGLAGLTTSLLFVLAMFFGPILSNVPQWASGIALIFTGMRMIRFMKEIDWDNSHFAIPAFTTFMLMAFTHSITNGLVAGLGMYAFISGGNKFANKLMNKGWKEEKAEEIRLSKTRPVQEENELPASHVDVKEAAKEEPKEVATQNPVVEQAVSATVETDLEKASV